MPDDYEKLKAEVKKLRAEGRVSGRPTDEERADWAYGTTVMENPKVTREMARKAVEKKRKPQ